jgi:[protein-PII] uridylyltransferase
MQHDLFHVYTVDEHILMVIRNLRRFTEAQHAHEYPLCSRLMADFERRELLYVAGLFHDIAKGRGGDHSTLGARDARRFCREHGMRDDDGEIVEWLVANHLFMSSTAQKQDLSDPDVIAAFAAKVKNERRLSALYLLTVATSAARARRCGTTGKASCSRTSITLRARSWKAPCQPHGDGQHRRARARKPSACLRLLRRSRRRRAALWKHLDTPYFQRTAPRGDRVACAPPLLARRRSEPVVKARLSRDGAGYAGARVLPDQPFLFARLAGSSVRTGLSISRRQDPHRRARHGRSTPSTLNDPGAARGVVSARRCRWSSQELTRELARSVRSSRPPKAASRAASSTFLLHTEVQIFADDKGTHYILEDRRGGPAGSAGAHRLHAREGERERGERKDQYAGRRARRTCS